MACAWCARAWRGASSRLPSTWTARGGDSAERRGPRAARDADRLMDSELFSIATDDRTVTDVTTTVAAFCAGRGDGLCHVFAPHATAGLALMETGSGSESDLDALLERLLPRDDRYVHRHGSIGHGADHLLPVLVS